LSYEKGKGLKGGEDRGDGYYGELERMKVGGFISLR